MCVHVSINLVNFSTALSFVVVHILLSSSSSSVDRMLKSKNYISSSSSRKAVVCFVTLVVESYATKTVPGHFLDVLNDHLR